MLDDKNHPEIQTQETTKVVDLNSYRPGFSSIQKLAIHIIAHLVMTDALDPIDAERDEGRALHYLYTDIQEALKTGIPQVDLIELQQIHSGKQTND